MIGIVILVVIAVILGGFGILAVSVAACVQWLKLRRKWRAKQSGAPYGIFLEAYQPKQLDEAWREPLEFEATKPCPHCGFYHTHLMMAPITGDNPDASTVRKCKMCLHRWAEK